MIAIRSRLVQRFVAPPTKSSLLGVSDDGTVGGNPESSTDDLTPLLLFDWKGDAPDEVTLEDSQTNSYGPYTVSGIGAQVTGGDLLADEIYIVVSKAEDSEGNFDWIVGGFSTNGAAVELGVPDLPVDYDTTLPTNAYDSATHTPSNNSELQDLFDGIDIGTGVPAPGDVIELTAGTDYGTIVIPKEFQGASDNWYIVRTSAYASLPAAESRLRPSDLSNNYLATLSRAPSAQSHQTLRIQNTIGVAAACYVWFLGIEFEMTGSYGSDIFSMVWLSTHNASQTDADMCNNIVWDRCHFTCDNAIKIQDAIRFDGYQCAVIDSRFTNLYGAGNDGSNALRTYRGGELKVHNCSIACRGAAWFLGDNDVKTPRNHDMTYTRNFKTEDNSWTGTQKTGFETKDVTRLLIDMCYWENCKALYGCVHLKSDGSGGPKETSHVTIRRSIYHSNWFAFYLHAAGSVPGPTVGPNSWFMVEDCIVFDETSTGSSKGRIFIASLSKYAGPNIYLDNLTLRHNTFPGQHLYEILNNYPTPATNGAQQFRCFDNILTHHTGNGFGSGARAVNGSYATDYNVQNNCYVGQSINSYDNNATYPPHGTMTNNLFPANNTAMMYEDFANKDFRLATGSPGENAASNGSDIGADVAAICGNDAVTPEVGSLLYGVKD